MPPVGDNAPANQNPVAAARAARAAKRRAAAVDGDQPTEAELAADRRHDNQDLLALGELIDAVAVRCTNLEAEATELTERADANAGRCTELEEAVKALANAEPDADDAD